MEEKKKLLTSIADNAKELADCLSCPTPSLSVHLLARCCGVGPTFIGKCGLPFKFAKMELQSKVSDLWDGAKPDETVEGMIDREIEQNCAKNHKSGTRSLIRVKRSIVMLKVMFQQMLRSGESSFKDAVLKSYEQSFAAFHGWAHRTAVFAALPQLPTRAKLMKKLKENEASMTVKMQSFVDSSALIVQYIKGLFYSRESVKELLEQI